MKLLKNNLSEKLIINKYLKKLNFKNKGTFDFENDGKIWVTEGLDFEAVSNDEMAKDGYLVLNFIDGSKVAIGFDK